MNKKKSDDLRFGDEADLDVPPMPPPPIGKDTDFFIWRAF